MTKDTLENRYMEFILGDQPFALPLTSVKEVISKPEITSVPNMPAHFEGMINLRGRVIGVFNVRKKLNAKPRNPAATSPEIVVVIEECGVNVGMIVDEVTCVRHVTADMLKSAPLKEGDPARQFIVSVIQKDDFMILTVDVSKLLELDKYKLAA